MIKKNKNSGKFIVIEGTDGSGKTEQFKLLANALKERGFEVKLVDFPQYGQPSAYFVQRYLNGDYGSLHTIGPKLASVFYAIDRIDVATEIRAALREGKIVLANRYIGSNMGHQGAKVIDKKQRRQLINWIYDFEYNICGIPKPSINIFLHVPAEIAYELISHKLERSYLKGKKRDIHEADIKHLKHAEQTYLEVCKFFNKDFKIIECATDGKLFSIDAIHQLILKTLPPSLKKRT